MRGAAKRSQSDSNAPYQKTPFGKSRTSENTFLAPIIISRAGINAGDSRDGASSVLESDVRLGVSSNKSEDSIIASPSQVRAR